MRSALFLIPATSGLVAGLSVLVAWLLEAAGRLEISIHGYIAMALGAFFTFALTAGLMALVFYSNRHGYDDEVGVTDEIDERIP